MDLKEAILSRYATKSFDGRTVPNETVDELIELIRQAPTSFNVQPWKVRIIADADTRSKLVEASWNQPQITSCSHLFVFCADSDLEAAADRLEEGVTTAGLPAEKVKGFLEMIRKFIGGLPAEARLAWAQRQTYIALAHGLLGAKALGFDSCPMEGFESAEYARILGLPEHLVPTVLMTIGYANDKPYPKYRNAREQMFM